MRFIVVLFILFVSSNGYGQWKSYIIGAKGDTLNCIDMKGLKQGRWVEKHDDLRGEPGYEEEGVYINNRKDGLWRRYNLLGDLSAMENYMWGMKDGECMYFTAMGNPIRKETWLAINPDKVYDTIDVENVDKPGQFDRVVIKNEGASLKHGKWNYYDPSTGYIEKTEFYRLGQLDNNLIGGDATAKDSTKTAASAPPKEKTKPKEILDYEKKNAGKKNIKVRDGQTGF